MKSILCALAFLLAGAAQAGTTVLDGEQCTNSKICYDIPNDAGAAIDLYAVVIHPFVYLYVNGDQYKGTLPGVYPYPSNIDNLLMQDPLGNIVYLTAAFSSHRTCARYCTVHWTLISGSIVSP